MDFSSPADNGHIVCILEMYSIEYWPHHSIWRRQFWNLELFLMESMSQRISSTTELIFSQGIDFYGNYTVIASLAGERVEGAS